MATPQVKDLVLHSPAGSNEVITFPWPLQVGSGQDRHDNGIDIIDTIKFVCDELPSISSAFEEINLHKIDTACYKTMTNLVDRFNKAVDSVVALEKGTSLPAERLNKFAHPSLLRHILQLVYNAAVLDPDKLNQYEPFSPEVYGETSYEFVQQMIKHVQVTHEDTFIDLGSGVGQVVLQMAGSFPLKTCIGIEKADTPSQYAERMDVYFRQFMAWFGKRYCEYKLIKGDFLMDEHREKITGSSLVFVNNFAFGPNVDHQLKERFADMRDGARVVSSKSFCPLNFRITDRNLSDIGTIMHVSEIPPLKGSVSWTCKPVAYYLHIIDRTILERYFQRLKIQKGSDNDHHVGGTARTTRDRAKREAHSNHNNHHNNHQQQQSVNTTNISATMITNGNNGASLHSNNSSNATNSLLSSSPLSLSSSSSSSSASLIANAMTVENTTNPVPVIATVKAVNDQQQQQQGNLSKTRQQQRGTNDSTTTDSDLEGNGILTHNRNCNGDSGGSNARKVWSDWEVLRYQNLASEDEVDNSNGVRRHFVNIDKNKTNGNNSSNIVTNGDDSGHTSRPPNAVNGIGVVERKRKLTRKAANVNKQNMKKNLTANNITTKEPHQRNNGSAALTASLIMTPKRAGTTATLQKRDNANNNSITTTNNTTGTGTGRGRKGRIRKGTRGRKSLKIVGLDALHKQTLLSTSVEKLSKKQPTAPGCIDQQLTSLLTDNMAHAELEIPAAPQDTPYALQILLDVFRSQYMAMIEQMKSKSLVPTIKKQIQMEEERKKRIRSRASQLDKQIKVLIDDSVALLKIRMNELGISVSSPNDLIAKAKEIVGRHKDLQGMAKRIQSQVHICELEQHGLIKRNLQVLPKYKNFHLEHNPENGSMSNDDDTPMDLFNDINELSHVHINSTETLEMSVKFAHDVVLKEIAKTLVERQRLVEQVNIIERESEVLERTVENKNLTSVLIANHRNNNQHQQQHQPLSLTTNHMSNTQMNYKFSAVQSSTLIDIGFKGSGTAATSSYSNHKLRLTSTATSHPAVNSVALVNGCNNNNNNNQIKSLNRRNREYHQKYRSQEWPDIPDVAKIEESNPEVLAQKILETGRKIEAKKFENIQLEAKELNNQNINNNNTGIVANASDYPIKSLHKNYLNNNQYYNTVNDNHQNQMNQNISAHDNFQYMPSQSHLNQQHCNDKLRVNNVAPVQNTHSQSVSSESGSSSQNSSTNIKEGEVIACGIGNNHLLRGLNVAPIIGGETVNLTPSSSGINSKTGSSRTISGSNNNSLHLLKHDLLKGAQRKCLSNDLGSQVGGNTSNVITAAGASGVCVQESPKVANFEDRLKSIITSALNEDQEQRKAASNNSSILMLQTKYKEMGANSNTASTPSLHLFSGKRTKGISAQTSIATLPQTQTAAGISQQFTANNQAIISSSLDIKTKINGLVSTASFMTSPINSAATTTTTPTPTKLVAISPNHLTNGGIPTTTAKSLATSKIEYTNKTNNCCISSNMAGISDHKTVLPKCQPQQQQQLNHNQYITNKSYYGNRIINNNPEIFKADTVLIHEQQNRQQHFHPKAYHHLQQPPFVGKAHEQQRHHQYHDQQQHHCHNQQIFPSGSVLVNSQQQQQQISEDGSDSISPLRHCQHPYHSNCTTSGPNQSLLRPVYQSGSCMPLEFKTPASSRDSTYLEETSPLSSQRDSLVKVEYANINGLEQGARVGLGPNLIETTPSKTTRHLTHHQKQPLPLKSPSPSVPSRPNSSSSQPDYTQVSPAKMALRRHLSQERLYQSSCGSGVATNSVNTAPQVASKTIGDLVNGEIERTLEITHQSIINAVVNMSTVGGGVHSERTHYFGEKTSYGGIDATHAIKQTNEERERNRDRLIINSNIARPERPEHFSHHLHQHQLISKRPEELTNPHSGIPSYKKYNQESLPITNGNTEHSSPYRYPLTNLAHIANERKSAHSEGVNLTSGMLSLTGNGSVIDDSNSSSKNEILSKYQTSAGQLYAAVTTSVVGTGVETMKTTTRNFGKNPYTGSNFSKNTPDGGNGLQIMAADHSVYYTRRDYQPVTLPKAEIKPCIEAYFHEENKHINPNRNHQTRQTLHENQHNNSNNNSSNHSFYNVTGAAVGGPGLSFKERSVVSNNKNVRMNGSNSTVPLEGLAASLQDRMLASQKFRVEHEERQRKAAVAATMAATTSTTTTTRTGTSLNNLSNGSEDNVTDGSNNDDRQSSKLLLIVGSVAGNCNGSNVEHNLNVNNQQVFGDNNVVQNRVKSEDIISVGVKRRLSQTENKYCSTRPPKMAHLIHDGLTISEQVANVHESVKPMVRGGTAINTTIETSANSNCNNKNRNNHEQQGISRNIGGTQETSTAIMPMEYNCSAAEISTSSITGSQLTEEQLLQNPDINFKAGLNVKYNNNLSDSNNKGSLLNSTSQSDHYSSHKYLQQQCHHQQKLHSIQNMNKVNNNYHQHLSPAINLSPPTLSSSPNAKAVRASNNINSKAVTVAALSQQQIGSSLSSSSSSLLSMSLTSTSSAILTSKGNSNMLVTRVADDDDVIADDETLWQDRVSSGFDRLVAFASTELDKTRRSIDTDTIIASASASSSSISCNTSPDSGITHSSLNSDTSRTFLSISSTSSQLNVMPPIDSGGNSSSSSSISSGSCFSANHNQHHSGHSHTNLSQTQLQPAALHYQPQSYNLSRSAAEGDGSREKTVSSPLEDTSSNNESPPSFLDNSLPRTPSPSMVIMMSRSTPTHTPPPPPPPPSSEQSILLKTNSTHNCNNGAISNNNKSQEYEQHSYHRNQYYHSNNLGKINTEIGTGNHNNNSGIPLKYQRIIKSKTPLEKHYKKKFCERNWGEFDNQDDQIQIQNKYYNLKNNASNSILDVSGKLAMDDKSADKNPIQKGDKDKDANLSMEKQVKLPTETVDLDEVDGVGRRAVEQLQRCQNSNSNVSHFTNVTSALSKNGSELQKQFSPHTHHKSSKFRPKGKDWDWSSGDNSSIGGSAASVSMSFSSSTTSAASSPVTVAYLTTAISVTTSSK